MIQENFIRLFEDSYRNHYDLPAFSNFGEKLTLTYGQAAQEITKLHLLFEQLGIERDDKIALIGKNNANWAIAYVASITYGAVIVPILQDFNANDIHHIINHSESKLLLTSDLIWDKLDEDKLYCTKAVFSLTDFSNILILENRTKKEDVEKDVCECLHYGKEISADEVSKATIEKLFAEKYPNGFCKDDIRYIDKPNSELVCISYTSGTTGFSKGVMLSGNALAGNITFGFKTKLLQKGYNVVSFLPLAHAYGCAFDFLTANCAGTHIHFLGRPPVAKILLKAFADIRPDVIFCVPMIIEKIYKKQIQPLLEKKSMRWVLSVPFLDQTILNQIKNKLVDAFGGNFREIVVGGAPLNAEVEAFFRKIKFPFTVGYGMTECAPLISYSNKDEFVSKSSGKLLDTMEAKIDNPKPDNGVGEILVRGENVMSGYYKNEEATNEIFTEDGWLRTGDLGTIDEEKNIFIRGRNKTMLLTANGQNVYPEEIEAKLNNMPYVLESLVIEKGGKLVALVCPDYEVIDDENINEEELKSIMENNRQTLNTIVAKYESVTKIELYPTEFEKTPKKSIKRYLYSSTQS